MSEVYSLKPNNSKPCKIFLNKNINPVNPGLNYCCGVNKSFDRKINGRTICAY